MFQRIESRYSYPTDPNRGQWLVDTDFETNIGPICNGHYIALEYKKRGMNVAANLALYCKFIRNEWDIQWSLERLVEVWEMPQYIDDIKRYTMLL